MKDILKAAMKAALNDMGITLDDYNNLELVVKQMQEVHIDDAIIRKESVTTIKIE